MENVKPKLSPLSMPVVRDGGARRTLLILAGLFLLVGCGTRERAPERRQESEFLLGTVVSIMIRQNDVSDEVFDRAFERTGEIQNLMSINEEYYDTTELLEINRNAGVSPVRVSPETYLVIEEGVRFSALTDGAFDITVAPLVRLWGFGTESPRVPSRTEIEQVLEYVDHGRVRMEPDRDESRFGGSVYLGDDAMGIDVGGIAKGYAAEEAARVLREEGVESAILDFGGDIVTIGGRPDGTAWRIGIQHPGGERARFLGVLESRDESVVSSGAYERYFTENGIRYHHIFDPATGYPSESGLTSVTVVGVGAMQTDALSTAIFVMGLEAGLALLDELPDYEGIISTEDKRLVVTAGLAERFEIVDDEHELLVHRR